MTRYNDTRNRNHPAAANYGTRVVIHPELHRPCPPAGRSFSAGFNAGFCDGIGKFLGFATKALPLVNGLRKGV